VSLEGEGAGFGGAYGLGGGEKNPNMGLDEDGVVSFSHSLHSWLPLFKQRCFPHLFPPQNKKRLYGTFQRVV